jgi:hypothetical protein
MQQASEVSEAAKKVPKRSAGVAWQGLQGEMVLLRTLEAELLGLSEVGQRIWELSDGERSVQEIATTLAQEFDVTLQTATEDCMRFLDELIAIRCIHWRQD